MIFGAFMAGATAEGGGAFAFPIFTLFLKIPPSIARDFSWLIQSVGMTCAALTIIARKQRIFFPGLIMPLIGSLTSTPFAYYVVKDFPPLSVKLFFVSLWLGFLFAYFRARKMRPSPFTLSQRQLVYLGMIGWLGGWISGFVGSGLDLLTFAFLVLYLKRDIKEATATSVILMAVNSLISSLSLSRLGLISDETYLMWWSAIPVVTFMAPLGVWFVEKGRREWVFNLLALSICAQFVAALIILPWEQKHLFLMVCVTSLSIAFFIALSRAVR